MFNFFTNEICMSGKLIKITFLSLALLLPFSAWAQTETRPETMQQKAAYAIGINFINSLKMQGIKLDEPSLLQGIQDALKGQLVLSHAEMQSALDEFKQQLIIQQQLAQKTLLKKNQQEGEAFLSANKTKEGVVTLPSGLQYRVIKKGSGPSPKLTDKVTTHYRGTLIDGTEFDSSYSRNQPATFPVNGVIPGWTEALQLMHKGDKWQLFIPSELAYGNRAVGDKIKPGSTLIFEIELLDIN